MFRHGTAFTFANSRKDRFTVHRLKLFTAIAATALVTLGLSPAAPTANAQPGGLPPIGAEIPCSMYAANVPVRIHAATLSLDFRGGIKVRVEVNPDDPVRSVRLKVVGFRMEADLIDVGEIGIGKVIIEQNEVDVAPQSLLKLTQNFPPRYENLLVLNFTLTIDAIGGDRADVPLVLETRNPAVLIGNLTQFPPRGDLYRLQNPVDLVLPDAPDLTIATIDRFPVKVGGI
jgi:hypothetical protein